MVNAGKWIVPSRQKKLPQQQIVDVYFESYERCIISNRKKKTFKTLSSKNYSIIKFHFHDSQDLSHVIYFMPSSQCYARSPLLSEVQSTFFSFFLAFTKFCPALCSVFAQRVPSLSLSFLCISFLGHDITSREYPPPFNLHGILY